MQPWNYPYFNMESWKLLLLNYFYSRKNINSKIKLILPHLIVLVISILMKKIGLINWSNLTKENFIPYLF
jgi:hypothetical protein